MVTIQAALRRPIGLPKGYGWTADWADEADFRRSAFIREIRNIRVICVPSVRGPRSEAIKDRDVPTEP